LSPPVIVPGESLDALSGHFRILQLRRGHRFSTDDVLTALVRNGVGTVFFERTRSRIRYRLGRDDRGMAACPAHVS
jgi:hypothetical protein